MNTEKRRDEFVTRELKANIQMVSKKSHVVGKEKDKLITLCEELQIGLETAETNLKISKSELRTVRNELGN
jgi:hypothetical protein